MMSGLQGLHDHPELFRYISTLSANTKCWSITATDADGNLRWCGWFCEKKAADRFMAATREGYIPDYLRPVPVPAWVPGLGEELLEYECQTIEFLISSPGVQQDWTVPLDWNDNNNSIEVLAGGASGGTGSGNFGNGASAGGGAAYSSDTNVDLGGAATIPYTIGSASGDSWFDGTSLGAATISAEGGAVRTGGDALNGIGAVRFSGGTGGVGSGTGGGPGGGAGGSAGPGGEGRNGANASSSNGGGGGGSNGGASTAGSGASGGQGPNGTGGGSGSGSDGGGGGGGSSGGGGSGGTNIVWSPNGIGGGGGGGGSAGSGQNGRNGGSGGAYGGGGGGGGGGGTNGGQGGPGGAGRQGIIVITYVPRGGSNRGFVFG